MSLSGRSIKYRFVKDDSLPAQHCSPKIQIRNQFTQILADSIWQCKSPSQRMFESASLNCNKNSYLSWNGYFFTFMGNIFHGGSCIFGWQDMNIFACLLYASELVSEWWSKQQTINDRYSVYFYFPQLCELIFFQLQVGILETLKLLMVDEVLVKEHWWLQSPLTETMAKRFIVIVSNIPY